MPCIANGDERIRTVEPAREPDDESLAQASLDIEVAVEVRLEEPDMSEKRGADLRARVAEDEGEGGIARPGQETRSVGEAHREDDIAALAGFGELPCDQRPHRDLPLGGLAFRQPIAPCQKPSKAAGLAQSIVVHRVPKVNRISELKSFVFRMRGALEVRTSVCSKTSPCQRSQHGVEIHP